MSGILTGTGGGFTTFAIRDFDGLESGGGLSGLGGLDGTTSPVHEARS